MKFLRLLKGVLTGSSIDHKKDLVWRIQLVTLHDILHPFELLHQVALSVKSPCCIHQNHIEVLRTCALHRVINNCTWL